VRGHLYQKVVLSIVIRRTRNTQLSQEKAALFCFDMCHCVAHVVKFLQCKDETIFLLLPNFTNYFLKKIFTPQLETIAEQQLPRGFAALSDLNVQLF
jgi:hypothetical protein